MSLSWNIVGWSIGFLVPIGIGVMDNEPLVAKFCFCGSAAIVIAKVLLLAVPITDPRMRMFFTAACFAVSGIVLVESFRWTDRKSEQNSAGGSKGTTLPDLANSQAEDLELTSAAEIHLRFKRERNGVVVSIVNCRDTDLGLTRVLITQVRSFDVRHKTFRRTILENRFQVLMHRTVASGEMASANGQQRFWLVRINDRDDCLEFGDTVGTAQIRWPAGAPVAEELWRLLLMVESENLVDVSWEIDVAWQKGTDNLRIAQSVANQPEQRG